MFSFLRRIKLFTPARKVNTQVGVWITFPWQVMLVTGEEYRRMPAWWDGRAESYARENL